jgi:PPOX class probable FMN-dependent enzyme
MAPDALSSYRPATGAAVKKEISEIDAHCARFLELCPFVVVSSATPDGSPDLTPRGGQPGFVGVLDPRTLVLPDRSGNNRLDTLRKVAANPRVALLCLVPGIDETLRIYGRAELRAPEDVAFDTVEHGKPAISVMVIHVERAFMHCAKALMRGHLWDPDARVPRDAFPSMSQVMRDHTGADDPLEDQDDMRRRYATDL